ncbi:MAG: nucleotidyltransferase domain-containing protein, partial [Burkholderiaceae bacterium]
MNEAGFRLRDQLRAERERLIAAFLAGGGVEALWKDLSQATDQVVRQATAEAGLAASAAVVAVGGYGRDELFPYSDVDILLLLPHAPDAVQRETIERLVGQLWDLGLALGHSVRTLDECREEAAADVTALTAMLESRLITGNRALYQAFR